MHRSANHVGSPLFYRDEIVEFRRLASDEAEPIQIATMVMKAFGPTAGNSKNAQLQNSRFSGTFPSSFFPSSLSAFVGEVYKFLTFFSRG